MVNLLIQPGNARRVLPALLQTATITTQAKPPNTQENVGEVNDAIPPARRSPGVARPRPLQ